MTTTYTIDSAPELLSHEAHLPETVTCSCGYNREAIDVKGATPASVFGPKL